MTTPISIAHLNSARAQLRAEGVRAPTVAQLHDRARALAGSTRPTPRSTTPRPLPRAAAPMPRASAPHPAPKKAPITMPTKSPPSRHTAAITASIVAFKKTAGRMPTEREAEQIAANELARPGVAARERERLDATMLGARPLRTRAGGLSTLTPADAQREIERRASAGGGR